MRHDELLQAAEEWAARMDRGDDYATIETEIVAKYGIRDEEFSRVQEQAHMLAVDDG